MKILRFGISKIKQFRKRLKTAFDFKITDIGDEACAAWYKKCNPTSLTDEEKALTERWRNKDGYNNPFLCALLSPDIIIKSEMNDKYDNRYIMQLCLKFFPEDRKAVRDTSFSLNLMAYLFFKDVCDGGYHHPIDYEEQQYLKYINYVRPDMLRLYCALMQPSAKDINEISISIRKGKTVHLQNEGYWIEDALKEYLDKYLGVKSLEEAKKELIQTYGAVKGRSLDNPYFTRYMWGTYQLLQYTPLKSSSVTSEQCQFIHLYLKFLKLIQENETVNIEQTIRSKLNYFIGKYSKIEDILDYRKRTVPFKSIDNAAKHW